MIPRREWREKETCVNLCFSSKIKVPLSLCQVTGGGHVMWVVFSSCLYVQCVNALERERERERSERGVDLKWQMGTQGEGVGFQHSREMYGREGRIGV